MECVNLRTARTTIAKNSILSQYTQHCHQAGHQLAGMEKREYSMDHCNKVSQYQPAWPYKPDWSKFLPLPTPKSQDAFPSVLCTIRYMPLSPTGYKDQICKEIYIISQYYKLFTYHRHRIVLTDWHKTAVSCSKVMRRMMNDNPVISLCWPSPSHDIVKAAFWGV